MWVKGAAPPSSVPSPPISAAQVVSVQSFGASSPVVEDPRLAEGFGDPSHLGNVVYFMFNPFHSHYLNNLSRECFSRLQEVVGSFLANNMQGKYHPIT